MTEVKTPKPKAPRTPRAPRVPRAPQAAEVKTGAPEAESSAPASFISAIGRRKQASARVRLIPQGTGAITVNAKPYQAYFPTLETQYIVAGALKAVNRADAFDVSVRVQGGGVRGQAEAVRLGIARALVKFNAELKPSLRKAGFLTRDARVRERKKYGLKSARRAPQWAKR